MSINSFFTLYWVEDNELLDCEYATMEQALQRFEYLKNSWESCLPDMWLLSLLIIVLTNLSDLILIICWLIELNFLRVLMLILS